MPRRFLPRFDPAIGLVALLLTINLLAVVGLASARRDAESALDEQRSFETRADARTFEALLAEQHAGLSFLARTAPLATLEADPMAGDPVSRRWSRLDVEATLLRFLESSPAVSRLEVSWSPVGLWAVAVRSQGVPQLASPAAPPAEDLSLVSARWPLGDGAGSLAAWIDPAPLLATTGPGLTLHRSPPAAPPGSVEPVASGLWTPPFEGWVERGQSDSSVVHTVERLAELYGWTLFFNVALIPLSLVLAGLTLRRVRRLARLESEAAQRARMEALEGQVRHAERLASLGRFAAGIAHEINNPLEGMANYLDLLREDLESGSAADARRWLPRLREGIDRAAGTVRQVLRFAEPSRGAKRETDLAEVAESTVRFLRGHPDCAKAEIGTRSPAMLPITGDPQTLGQLVLNLVLNACQAQPEGARVEVRTKQLPAGAELAVLDRGPGFAPEILERLFEPFGSTRGSLGLGLAVCHGIALDHGGTIQVSARPGGGALVQVRLPAKPPGAENR